MRTKTLLITIGALAVGALSSMAAPVTSINDVGYANVVTPGNGGTFYLMECPFAVGVSNGVNEVFGTSLPDTSQVLTWNGAGQTFVTVTYDSQGPNGLGWYDANEDPGLLTTLPTVAPGQGFFLLPTGPVTNAFVGAVAVNNGATNTMNLPGNGGTYFLVGSTIPFDGSITNPTAINLNNLPDTSQVLTWNGPGQTFVTVTYDSAGPNGAGWYDANEDPGFVAVPTVTVGTGFFVLPTGTYNWQQVLTP
jgi:hypothetical protein